MASTVVNSDTSDGYVVCTDVAVYSNAREGTGTLSAANSVLFVGQDFDSGQFECYEGFLNFDLLGAGIPANATVTSAVFELYLVTFQFDTNFNVDARTKNWGSTIDTADFVAGSSLGGLTLLGSAATTGFTGSAYNTITESGTALKDATTTALVGDGVVRILLDSSRQVSGDAPTPVTTPYEYAQFRSSHDAAGNRPKLTVTYTVPASTDPYVAPMLPHPPHLRAKTDMIVF